MTLRANQIAALASAIERLQTFAAPADAVLSAYFRNHPESGQRDRSLIAEGAYAYLRHKRSLEAYAQSTEPRRLAIAVIVHALGHSLRDVEPALKRQDVAWLAESKARRPERLPPAAAADLPDWLWTRLGELYGEEERTALVRALNAPAPMDLRVNPMKLTRDEALVRLRGDGLDVAPTPHASLGLRVRGRPALQRHPLFLDGSLEVQDEGSQLLAHLVAPRRGEMVVDFCAGAGGKTLLLGALMRSQGRLYAFDVDPTRLARLTPRLRRSGLSNVHPQLITSERDPKVKRLAGKIDRVLVDAPCTGLGTLRRNPDLKWRTGPDDVTELAQKQKRILAAAATLVKPGGRLVYATCSLLPEENEAIVADFAATHPQFVPVDASTALAAAGVKLGTGPTLRLAPHRDGCDGFFAALFERSRK
jgi:16S rRNA (cytosine967-C5)-methyltransferase